VKNTKIIKKKIQKQKEVNTTPEYYKKKEPIKKIVVKNTKIIKKKIQKQKEVKQITIKKIEKKSM